MKKKSSKNNTTNSRLYYLVHLRSNVRQPRQYPSTSQVVKKFDKEIIYFRNIFLGSVSKKKNPTDLQVRIGFDGHGGHSLFLLACLPDAEAFGLIFFTPLISYSITIRFSGSCFSTTGHREPWTPFRAWNPRCMLRCVMQKKQMVVSKAEAGGRARAPA